MKSRGRTHRGSFEAMLTPLRNFHHSHERQKQRQKQRQSTENDETIKQMIWLLATDLSDEKNFFSGGGEITWFSGERRGRSEKLTARQLSRGKILYFLARGGSGKFYRVTKQNSLPHPPPPPPVTAINDERFL